MTAAGPGSDAPNVLLIMVDEMKATASHLYGNPDCHTPSLQRLAETGIRYDAATTPHPLCTPSRVSFWTGQYSHTHGCQTNGAFLRSESPTPLPAWKEAGYEIGLIGKNHCFGEPEHLASFDTWLEVGHWGLAETPPRGAKWVVDPVVIENSHAERRAMRARWHAIESAATDFDLEGYSTRAIARQVEDFLARPRSRPFALWVSIPDPHPPFEAPRSYVERFDPDRLTLPGNCCDVPAGATDRMKIFAEIMAAPTVELRRALATYYAMIQFLDDAVGSILDVLERTGQRERTIVIFCSDHGDFAGEFGLMEKGGMLYDALVRVPLIVSWPGHVPAGIVDAGPVSLIDVIPTVMALQGLPVPTAMQGRTLPSATQTPPRDAVYAEYGKGGPAFTRHDLNRLPAATGRRAKLDSLQPREAEGLRRMIRTKEWKFCNDPMGDRNELYDLVNDPWEEENLALEPRHGTRVAQLSTLLERWSTQEDHDATRTTDGAAP